MSPECPLILSLQGARKGDPSGVGEATRLSYHRIYCAVEKIGKLVGLPDLHPHLFRHTYATELLLMEVNPAHARRLTGHKSKQAFRRYTLRGEQQTAIAAFYRATLAVSAEQRGEAGEPEDH